MSKKQAIAFFKEISKNKQLVQEVKKVVDGKNSDEEKAKELISLAKKHNFTFTQEDAQNAQEELKKPLSTEEMFDVSGGKMNLKSSLMAMALLAGLGVGGATMSSMEASAMKRSNPSSSGKRGKTDQTLPGFDELISRLSNRAAQGQPTTNGNQQQITPQPAEATGADNLTQNGTPSSNGQATPQDTNQHSSEPPNEKKIRANVEHNKEAAKRFSGVNFCSPRLLQFVRGVASSGALPSADWPAAPTANLDAENGVCRFCGGTLSTRGKKALDVKCANAGCIYNWVFPPAGNKELNGNQRGQQDYGHYARWALLPALILDSRYELINSTGSRGSGTARQLAIETPAEAWAVWQLISQRGPVVNGVGRWPAIVEMMTAHEVDPAIQDEVIQLLDGSYGKLVLGNEHLRAIGLGREVQQLVAGHNTGWQNFIGAMVERGYGSEEVKQAVTKMINSYYMLNENQPRDSGYTPSPAARAEIEAAYQRFEIAMQQAEDARETARRQAIEKLQRGETLSIEQARAIAPMLKCVSCGNTGAYAYKTVGWVRLQCANNKCRKVISKKPANLLAMLQEGAPENVPIGMADAGRNEQHLQIEQEKNPTYEIKLSLVPWPQMGRQGMNQFNHGQQMRMQQNMFAMEMDDEEDYVDRDFYDRDKNPRKLKEQRPPEVKERREGKEQPEDYANPEPVFRYPDRQQQNFQQLNQMMNPNEFDFNFGGQGMNQFNLGQQMMMQHHDDFKNSFIEPYQLQTGNPNDFTFNTGLSQHQYSVV